MATQNGTVRKRNPESSAKVESGGVGVGVAGDHDVPPHPAGEVKYSGASQVIRALLLATWFNCGAVCINATQFLGAPLYWINKDYYYAYMALTKQSFAIMGIAGTRWFAPTKVRVSWDKELRGQFRKTSAGRLETMFPERLVYVANHQVYTEWLYLWWIAYTSRMHGHIFIILKESLKYVPILGPGMMFYGFIFMARKWLSDKPRLEHRLNKLKTRHKGPMSGSDGLDPMWLLIFPEGTNLSANMRKGSAKWAEKQGIPDMKHQLLPRSTGLFFILQQLQGTVDWVYDCTIAYEGTPKGGFAPEIFTIRSTYLQGRPPKSVNMYWRRFSVSSIPLADGKEFEKWFIERWREKDEILEQWYNTGRFPSDAESADSQSGISKDGFIETEMTLNNWMEIGQLYVVLATLALVINVVLKFFGLFSKLG
ncbi:putative acyltransferase [Cladophialophora carrionii]|uniref:Putative acyltransferase n=1 Tax=Cladophialophora carrionii TaxID=86049 RepID=A0A1C1D219_9EURO|nr:putative acyltransferase [Cladophialophora carrionii]